MAWRKHASHAEETKAVKKALAAAGIKAKVGHGRGTGWGWLEINVGPDPGPDADGCGPQRHSQAWRDRQDQALTIAQQITGRSGEYGGEILILAQ